MLIRHSAIHLPELSVEKLNLEHNIARKKANEEALAKLELVISLQIAKKREEQEEAAENAHQLRASEIERIKTIFFEIEHQNTQQLKAAIDAAQHPVTIVSSLPSQLKILEEKLIELNATHSKLTTVQQQQSALVTQHQMTRQHFALTTAKTLSNFKVGSVPLNLSASDLHTVASSLAVRPLPMQVIQKNPHMFAAFKHLTQEILYRNPEMTLSDAEQQACDLLHKPEKRVMLERINILPPLFDAANKKDRQGVSYREKIIEEERILSENEKRRPLNNIIQILERRLDKIIIFPSSAVTNEMNRLYIINKNEENNLTQQFNQQSTAINDLINMIVGQQLNTRRPG